MSPKAIWVLTRIHAGQVKLKNGEYVISSINLRESVSPVTVRALVKRGLVKVSAYIKNGQRFVTLTEEGLRTVELIHDTVKATRYYKL